MSDAMTNFLCFLGIAEPPKKEEEKEMPTLVLHYWDYNFWRAETLRITMTLGKVEFEDRFITNTKEWVASGIAPLGQAPVLEVDGKAITQTGAMARFVGKLSGHYPKDDFQAARVDMVIDTLTDMSVMVYGSHYRSMSEKERFEHRANLLKDPSKLPKYLTMLDREVKKNGCNGFISGDSLTIADIALWRHLGWYQEGSLDGFGTDCIEPYKQLFAYWKSLDKHPGIRAYWDARYGKKKE